MTPRRNTISALLAPAFLLLVALAAGCGAPPPPPTPPEVPLQSATLQEMVTTFNQNANAVRTMQLHFDLVATGGKKKEPSVQSYLLLEKPDKLRIWGTFPIEGKFFDMAAQNGSFVLSIPPRSQFIEGQDDVIPAKVENPLERLRPQVFLESLLTDPIASDLRVALYQGSRNTEYSLLVLQEGPGQTDRVVRRIIISRLDLLPSSQAIFAPNGTVTSVTYSHYTTIGGIPVPMLMEISRPSDNYSLRLEVKTQGSSINKPFAVANPFELTPPPGAAIVKLTATGPGQNFLQ